MSYQMSSMGSYSNPPDVSSYGAIEHTVAINLDEELSTQDTNTVVVRDSVAKSIAGVVYGGCVLCCFCVAATSFVVGTVSYFDDDTKLSSMGYGIAITTFVCGVLCMCCNPDIQKGLAESEGTFSGI